MKFAKDQMCDELRTIFLFEADHILLGRGTDIATDFIGFAAGDDGEYLHEAVSRVDLNKFQIAGSFDRGYDFGFNPSLPILLGEEEVQDLLVFMEGTPKVGGVSSGGEKHRFMTADGYCQTVVDTVHARWKLEWVEAGDFTMRELALLANMTEGAVRNAIADKSDNALKAVAGSKPVHVAYEEAKRWLSGRRGFIPSPRRPREDVVLHDRLRDLRSIEGLADLIARQFRLAADVLNQKISELGWTPQEVEAWQMGTFAFEVAHARQLAKFLDLDEALFVGKALELSLRRDLKAVGDKS